MPTVVRCVACRSDRSHTRGSADEPVHGHFVGDGDRHPPAVPDVLPAAEPARVRLRRRSVPGASAIVRVLGGYAIHRWQRYKEVAGLGYALSAMCRVGMLAVGRAWTILAAIVLAWPTGWERASHGASRCAHLAQSHRRV